MKLIDIKENITPRQRLILLFTILILVIVVFSFMKKFFSKKEGIDYKNVDYNNFIVESSETSDRNLYWTLNDILFPFLQSYQTVEKMDTSEFIEYKYTGRSLEDYYDALDKNYKKYLGKEEFISKSKEMMSKVFEKNDNGFVIKNENIIKCIYKLNNYDNAYLCEINTVNDDKSAFIGIVLNSETQKFSIFYIQ